MQNVVNFLLDYYLWILGVLAIVIITTIGFLADSKQKRKKKSSENFDEVKTVEPLPSVNTVEGNPVSNLDNVSNVKNAGVDIPLSNINANLNNVEQPTNLNGGGVVSDVNNSSQLLSQQTPHFEPKDVNVPTASTNVNNVMGPRPVNAVPINQSMRPQPVMQQPVQNVQMQQPVNQFQNVTPVQNYNNLNMGQPVGNIQNSGMAVNRTIQQTPVMSNPTVVSNMQQPVMQQPVQNSEVKPSSTPNVGINFVTGNSNGLANNEDMWKL